MKLVCQIVFSDLKSSFLVRNFFYVIRTNAMRL